MLDEGGTSENSANHLPLDSDAATVNNPDVSKCSGVRFIKVRFHNRLCIAGWNGMKIENICDWDYNRRVVVFQLVFELHFAQGAVRDIIVPVHSCGNKTIHLCSEAWLFPRLPPRLRFLSFSSC